jgi:hypothetical protein
MALVLHIKNNQDIIYTVDKLNRIRKKLPLMTSQQMNLWGKMLEKDMKTSAIRSGINSFSGNSQGTGIRYEQRLKGRTGYLYMPQYMVYLDRMNDHYVNVKPSRTRLLKWALQAENSKIRQKANEITSGKIKKFPLFVRRHEFIRNGWRLARPKLNRLLKLSTDRVVYGG